GCSLWLVPPKSSTLYSVLSDIITTTLPEQFPNDSIPTFVPHVTLTSNINPSLFTDSIDEEEQQKGAEAWLKKLDLPTAKQVEVTFQGLDVGQVFFKKLTLRVNKSGLAKLALVSRKDGVEGGNEEPARDWLESSYGPHCSLMYGDMDIAESKKAQIESSLENAGIDIAGNGSNGGWQGGVVWLVPTFKKIEEWQPWAERAL
ncbi:2',3'-cyclic-nucleotide 3'-phosphodiesterase, partial [Saccharata proteae CBS 121410]